jgi:hypothetical protein
MAKEQWSAETLRLREEASTHIDRLARSMEQDRKAWGRYDHLDDEQAEVNSLDGKQLTAWIVITQYQGFDDPEVSNVVYCTAGQTAATSKGLAQYAAEQY